MGVLELSETSIIVPRSELPELLTQLSEFEWFQFEEPESHAYDPRVNDLALRALKLQVEIGDLITSLGIKTGQGVIDMLKEGYQADEETFTARDWEGLVVRFEREIQPITEQLRNLQSGAANFRRQMEESRVLLGALELVSSLSTDLGLIRHYERFSATFAVMSLKDLTELRKTLPSALVEEYPITKAQSAVLIVSPRSDWETVEKILRGFEIKSFRIPDDLPQNPLQAHQIVRKRLSELEQKLNSVEEDLNKRVGTHANKLVAVHEALEMGHSLLDKSRRTGELKRFAVIQGYLPLERSADFQERMKRWVCLMQEPSQSSQAKEPMSHESEEESHESSLPTLIKNKPFVRAFEKITLNQGPPRHNEIDPTPIINLIFPIFFGIMFGDVGHGLVLAIFGLFLYWRVSPELKPWGQIFLASGIAAAVIGLLVGEVFGFELTSLVKLPFHPLEFVERGHGLARPNVEVVKTILKASLLIGIVHIFIGLVLNVVNGMKEREKVEAFISKIPLVVLFVSFIAFLLAFWAGGKNASIIGGALTFDAGLSGNSLFLLRDLGIHITVKSAAPVALYLTIGSILFMILGKLVAVKMGKIREPQLGMALFMEFVELAFERIPGFLANTLSYMRLTILLTVHASLLIAVNLMWGLGFAIAIVPVVIFNILVIILEGMIVYIQSLRLHLYEWFTKFYDGTGKPFQKINMQSAHATIKLQQIAATTSLR